MRDQARTGAGDWHNSCAAHDVRLKIGRVDSVRRTLRRHRRGALPAEPATLADVNISGKWKETTALNPQPFLIFDNGTTSVERVAIFNSPEQLRHLAMADRWFIKATFQCRLPSSSGCTSSVLHSVHSTRYISCIDPMCMFCCRANRKAYTRLCWKP